MKLPLRDARPGLSARLQTILGISPAAASFLREVPEERGLGWNAGADHAHKYLH